MNSEPDLAAQIATLTEETHALRADLAEMLTMHRQLVSLVNEHGPPLAAAVAQLQKHPAIRMLVGGIK